MQTTIKSFLMLCVATGNLCAGVADDIQLFQRGDKLVWDSTGHAKAKGIQLQISYPRTWKSVEGTRPNIVQKLISDSGNGKEMLIVLVAPLPEPYNRELNNSDKEELLGRDNAKLFMPKDGRLVSHQVTKIDGETCAMMEIEATNERLGLRIIQKSLTLVIPRRGGLLFIQFLTGGDETTGIDAINQHYADSRPLFLLIASSCVLLDKWK